MGFGPGGLMSDAELFGNREKPERYRMALESLDLILKLWREDAPLRWDGEHYGRSLERRVWVSHGVGQFARPLQQPHPPIAMAMVGPGGLTAQTIAQRDMIPISANFVPIENVVAQWRDYALAWEKAGHKSGTFKGIDGDSLDSSSKVIKRQQEKKSSTFLFKTNHDE